MRIPAKTTINSDIGRNNTRRETFCTCTKSNCQKNYCDCFKNGTRCTDVCRCVECKNTKVEEKVKPEKFSMEFVRVHVNKESMKVKEGKYMFNLETLSIGSFSNNNKFATENSSNPAIHKTIKDSNSFSNPKLSCTAHEGNENNILLEDSFMNIKFCCNANSNKNIPKKNLSDFSKENSQEDRQKDCLRETSNKNSDDKDRESVKEKAQKQSYCIRECLGSKKKRKHIMNQSKLNAPKSLILKSKKNICTAKEQPESRISNDKQQFKTNSKDKIFLLSKKREKPEENKENNEYSKIVQQNTIKSSISKSSTNNSSRNFDAINTSSNRIEDDRNNNNNNIALAIDESAKRENNEKSFSRKKKLKLSVKKSNLTMESKRSAKKYIKFNIEHIERNKDYSNLHYE